MRLDDWDNQGLEELQEQVVDALESRKEVDSKTQQTRDNQRKRENDFWEELAYLRSSTLKKIYEENKHCLEIRMDIYKTVAEKIENYVTKRGRCCIWTLKGPVKLDNGIIEIEVNGKAIYAYENEYLFDFLNGGLGVILGDSYYNLYKYKGKYYSEPILEQIPSGIEEKSLEDMRLLAIRNTAYEIYLEDLKRKLCLLCGHDWHLINVTFTNPKNIEAKYFCKVCHSTTKERYTSKKDVGLVPSKRKIMEMLNFDIEISEFRLEDYFVEVDKPKRRLRLIYIEDML